MKMAQVAASGTAPTGTTAIQVWTLVVAGLAVTATLASAYLLRRTGKGQVEAAKRAADSAHEAVGVNRETAIGVALRAEADALAKRYQDAAAQLGHERAPVRLAGVYAMAHLADDWHEQRRACVDVLCAYLRMPVTTQEAPDPDLEVRRTVLRLIESHTQPASGDASWSDLELDLRGARFEDSELHGCVFNGILRLDHATFHGVNDWKHLTVGSFASLAHTRIDGALSLLSERSRAPYRWPG